jgi:hypothetical protein
MKYLKIIFLLSILLTSCDSPVEVENNSVLLPLSVGNYWKYEIYSYSSTGEILSGLTDSLLLTIDEDVIVNLDGKIYKGGVMTRKFGENAFPETRWIYSNLNDGLYYLGGYADTDTLYKKILYLKYPTVESETWSLSYMAFNLQTGNFIYDPDSTTNITCQTLTNNIKTDIGEFDCICYFLSEKPAEDVLFNWDYYFYYAPNIGLVAMEVRSAYDNILIQKMILTDYALQ